MYDGRYEQCEPKNDEVFVNTRDVASESRTHPRDITSLGYMELVPRSSVFQKSHLTERLSLL